MPLYTIDNVWTGTASALWSTAGNWSTGAVPTIGQDLLIPAGTRDIDCTGMTGAAFGNLYIAPGAEAVIGGSGARCAPTSFTDVYHFGRGKLWLQGTNTRIMICSDSRVDALDLDGTTTQLAVRRGQVNIAGSAGAMSLLEVGYVSDPSNDTKVTIVAGAGTLTRLKQSGGLVLASNVITSGLIVGGTFVKRGTTGMTDLDLERGVTAYYEGTGTLTNLRAGMGARAYFMRNYSDSVGLSKGRQATMVISNWFDVEDNCDIDESLITVSAKYNWRAKQVA